MSSIEMYFSLKLWEFKVAVILTLLVLVIIGLAVLKHEIDKRTKKNCFNCKYYYLSNVSSVGGIGWYKCKIKGREDRHEANIRYNFVKCKEFVEDSNAR